MSAKKQGFLLVRESTKAWTRLWVSLRQHQLFIFRDKTKSQEVLKVNIKDAKISGTPSIHSYKTNVFEILLKHSTPLESPRQKTNVDADAIIISTSEPILLSAPSPQQKSEWIEKLSYCAGKDVFDEQSGDVSSDEHEMEATPQEQENLFVSFKDFPNVIFHVREEHSRADKVTNLVCAPLTNVNDIVKSLAIRLHTQPDRVHMYLVTANNEEQRLDLNAIIVDLVNKHKIATLTTPNPPNTNNSTNNNNNNNNSNNKNDAPAVPTAKLLVKEEAPLVTGEGVGDFKQPKKKKKLWKLGGGKKRKPSKEDVTV